MRSLWAMLSCLLIAGCADEGPPNPVLTAPTVEIPDAVPAGAVKRTVERRSPLGDTVGNLLVDGDFEMSVVIQGTSPQSGWLAFGGGAYLRGETGGLCRSGLRCAYVESGVLLFGQGASAKDSGMIASIWVRPPDGGSCAAVSASVLRCNSFQTAAQLVAETESPQPDGWCVLRGRIRPQTTGVCMLLESNSEPLLGTALVDDASILPDKGNVPLSANAIPEVTFAPLTGERRERVKALLDWRRKRMKIGAPLRDRPKVGER